MGTENVLKNADFGTVFTGFTLREKSHYAELELNQPFINKAMFGDLRKALEYLEDHVPSHFLVIKGSRGVFSKGLNFDDFHQGHSVDIADISRWEKLIEGVQNSSKTTIAVIDGICYGAGVQLALACDHRIASTTSRFAHTEIEDGYLPGCTIMQLGKFCGLGRLMELLMTGTSYTAQQAEQYGIVNDCTPEPEQLLQERLQQYARPNHKLLHLTRRLSREAFEMPYNNFIGCYQAAQYQAIINKQDAAAWAAEHETK